MQQSVRISEKSCLVETKKDKLVDEEFLAVCLTSGKDDRHPNRRLADFVLHDENGVLQLLEMLEFVTCLSLVLYCLLKKDQTKKRKSNQM